MRQAALIKPPQLTLTPKLILKRSIRMKRVTCIQIECQKIQPDCILDDHQMIQECKHQGIVYITRFLSLPYYNGIILVSCSYIGNNYFLIFKGIEHHHPNDKQKEVQVIIIIRFLVALYQEIPLTDQLRTHYCLQT